MENIETPVEQNLKTTGTTLDTSSSVIPKDDKKTNYWMISTVVLLILLLSTIIFGLYLFSTGTIKLATSTQATLLTSNLATPLPTTNTIVQPSTMPSGSKTFNNSKIDITFEYPTELSLDPNQSPRFYTDDPYNRWIIVLKTNYGDEINIQSGGPADWGDCKKRLDEKTFTTNVTLNYFKETLSNESYCEGGENYIGWYATATKDESTWFISLTTKDISQSKQTYLEPLFLNLVKSFKKK